MSPRSLRYASHMIVTNKKVYLMTDDKYLVTSGEHDFVTHDNCYLVTNDKYDFVSARSRDFHILIQM